MNKNFIVVSDAKLKEKLILQGYAMVSDNGKTWTFINDTTKPLKFSKEDKVAFTNVLTV